MLRGPWTWRARWRLCTGTAAGVATALVLGLLLQGGDGGQTVLSVEPEPSAGTSSTAAPQATASPTVTAAPTAAETASPAGSPSEEPDASPPSGLPCVVEASLLSDAFMNRAFGSGDRSRTRLDTWSPRGGCTPYDEGGSSPSLAHLEKEWSWPGEAAAEEHLAVARDEADARAQFRSLRRACAGGDWPCVRYAPGRAPQTTVRELELGDDAFLAGTVGTAASHEYALVRQGRALVGLAWRHAGRTGGDVDLPGLLAAALRHAQGADEPPAGVAGAYRALDAFTGFPTLTALPEAGSTSTGSLAWATDLLEEGPEGLPLAGPVAHRRWAGRPSVNDDPDDAIDVSLAKAASAESAAADFDAYAERVRSEPDEDRTQFRRVEGIGDDAFYVAHGYGYYSLEEEYTQLAVRVGAHYVWVDGVFLGQPALEEVMRTVLDGLRAAGRL